jgi:hypothetical protein
MTKDSMLTKIFLTRKMADHDKKRGTSERGNNMSQCVSQCSYNLYLKIIVIKHGEQRDSCEAARKFSVSWGKHPKAKKQDPELKSSSYIRTSVVICKIQLKNGMPVLCNTFKPIKWQEFKSSTVWHVQVMWRNRFFNSEKLHLVMSLRCQSIWYAVQLNHW